MEINKKLKREENKDISGEITANHSAETDTIDVTTRYCDTDGEEKELKNKGLSDHVESGASNKGASSNVMQTCIDCFQDFFHTLVSLKLMHDTELVEKCFDSLVVNSERFSSLEKGYGLIEDDGVDIDDECGWSGDLRIPLPLVDEKGLEAFSNACQLLVEFASFPMYCADTRQRDTSQKQGTLKKPHYFKTLDFFFFLSELNYTCILLLSL